MQLILRDVRVMAHHHTAPTTFRGLGSFLKGTLAVLASANSQWTIWTPDSCVGQVFTVVPCCGRDQIKCVFVCVSGGTADRRAVGAGSAASIFGSGYQWIY